VTESTPAGCFVFRSDPESNISEKPNPESLFNFGSSRSQCDHFSSKNMGKFRWINDGSWNLNRNRILIYEKKRTQTEKFCNRSRVGKVGNRSRVGNDKVTPATSGGKQCLLIEFPNL